MCKKPWLEVTSKRYNREDLASLIKLSDILVSDLDETAAKSPMKIAAKRMLRSPNILNPKFMRWCLKTGYALMKNGKKAESGAAKELIENFLSSKKQLSALQEWMTEEYAIKTIYNGALDFYSALPKAMKVFVTRSIPDIAYVYAKAAGFDFAMAQQFDKQESIKELMQKFPNNRRYVLIGDSEEDEAALDYLKFLWRYTKVETLASVYVAKSERYINERFDINIGRDYTGLVALVK